MATLTRTTHPIEQKFLWDRLYPTATTKVINVVNEQDKVHQNFSVYDTAKFLPHTKEHQWE